MIHLNKTFYQLDSTGNVRVWNIQVIGIQNNANIIINAGIENGKMIETITPITEGKNIGKINETTALGQALLDAQTEINTKIKKGYSDNRNVLKIKGETATIKAPMKAETYHPTGFLSDGSLKKGSYTLDGKAGAKKTTETLRGKTIGLERKYDGWRLRIKVNKNEVVFYTSSGDVTLNFPQIEAAVRKAFDKNIAYWERKYGVTEHILDGEIYRHNLQIVRDEKDNVVDFFYQDNTSGFQATASACGSTINLTPIKLKLRNEMQFHIFDVVIDDETVLLSTRKKIAANYVDNKVILPVETIKVVADEKIIDSYMTQFLNEGYEGLMIRVLDTPYEFKRSKYIFKYKPLMDGEYKIVGFKKSITGDTLGSFECEDENGVRFSANPMNDFGTDAKKLEIWNNQKDYLGKWITVIYLELTNDGVPRHGRAKGFRKGKSKD